VHFNGGLTVTVTGLTETSDFFADDADTSMHASVIYFAPFALSALARLTNAETPWFPKEALIAIMSLAASVWK